MADLIFMSQEHIDRMNELLGDSAEVAAACARLDRDYAIAYELSDGPGGTVYWTLRFDREAGASFSLEPPVHADVTYLSDWAEAIRFSRAAREGAQAAEPVLETRGDPSVTERVAEAYSVAQSTATLPTVFPEV
ncbi:hypothetical protein [Amycolatopsis echigonensis]|uniref:Uncharacterized protein n=1 Tax=Amycolatopsis echigonensis TaxID=2576905 RepID=A0A2N3X027_9PSEU|nr:MULTISPECIES: hypothetical protein [Amycolatopsis]MBB2503623.1 hypothetical protein [Amycolatopsis echigonensis]PKV99482.1 hypothetical protein ATK30_0456 [Amycolatopsis niigatensis]